MSMLSLSRTSCSDDVLPLSLARRILRDFPREDLPSDRHFNINYGGHL